MEEVREVLMEGQEVSHEEEPKLLLDDAERKKYSRRRDNNNAEDPNGWYKHRRKRNKRIRNGKNGGAGESDAIEASVEVNLDQFPYLLVSVPPPTSSSQTNVWQSSSVHTSLEDLQYIVYHLGYTPHNLMTVAYYHDEQSGTEFSKKPAVLQLYPLNPYANNNYVNRYDKDTRPFQHRKGETLFPFPTLFWMLSPSINTAVAALEEDGWIARLTERLQSDSSYISQMEVAHRAYAEERWQYLSHEHQQYVDEKGWTSNLRDVGIAGMQKFDAVKCLHTHYAHFLARPAHGNLVGQWVHELLTSPKITAESATTSR